MATTSISGTNKLAERIVGDAQAEARAVREEAEVAVREIWRESDGAVAARRAELLAQREAAAKSLIGGYVTRATLDAKKDALRKKRALIDEAFARCYGAVLALDAPARRDICARLLGAQAEGGETIVPARADRAALEQLAAAMTEKKLSLSQKDAVIDGGFILLGEGYEKDCSFRSLLDEVRDAEETAVYRLLFD